MRRKVSPAPRLAALPGIVGDALRDLTAARHNGMKCVLVDTGRYPVEELRDAAPDERLTDLRDTRAIVKRLSRV